MSEGPGLPDIPNVMRVMGTENDPALSHVNDPESRERIRKNREQQRISTERMLEYSRQKMDRMEPERARIREDGLRASEALIRAAFYKIRSPFMRKEYLNGLRETSLHMDSKLITVIEELERQLQK